MRRSHAAQIMLFGLIHRGHMVLCACVYLFLVLPLVAVLPMSFSAGSFLFYPLPGLSLRWYAELVTDGRWLLAFRNSFIVASASMVLATMLGTLAALGLHRARLPLHDLVNGLLLAPLVVPVVIKAVSVFMLFSEIGLSGTYAGLILAHTVLASPMVVICVGAALQGLDRNLLRAAASNGAKPWQAFRLVTLPSILPGVVSGALFAFIVSFDEVVVALFLAGPEQITLPRQLLSGIQEEITPVVIAASAVMLAVSLSGMAGAEALRRYMSRRQGDPP